MLVPCSHFRRLACALRHALRSQRWPYELLALHLLALAAIAFIFMLLHFLGGRVRGDDAVAAVRLTRDGDFKQHLQWSPDGKKLLFTRIHERKMGLWVMNADGSDLKRLFKHDDGPDFDGHWSPDSQKIIFVFDILHGTDGKLNLHTIKADGSDNKVLIPNKAFEESPRWSPDGKKIAFVSTRDGDQEIYTANADGSRITRLTRDPAMDNTPAWSPDSKRLAFTSGRHGDYEIHSMNADGTGVRRLTHNPGLDYWPAWSPDGKQIAFTSNRDGNYEIYLMAADGTKPRNLTRHPAQDNYAAWSPDGKKIAFISNRHGGHDVYVMDVR